MCLHYFKKPQLFIKYVLHTILAKVNHNQASLLLNNNFLGSGGGTHTDVNGGP